MDCFELDIGNVTYSGWDENGYLTVQWDSYGMEDGSKPATTTDLPVTGTSAFESHHMLGFVGRPVDPVLDPLGNADPAQSSNVMVGLMGGKGHAFPLEDTRLMPLLPQLQKGESMMYGPAWGQFCRMHADGTISLYTTTKSAFEIDSPGSPMFIRINPNAGDDQGFQFVGPFGMLIFGPSGFHVKMAGGGPRLNLGFLAGLPAPLDQLSTYFTVQAGLVHHDSSMVSNGPSNGVSGGPPALAQPLLLVLTEFAAAVSAALSAITSGAPTGGAPAATAFTSAIAPILTAAAASVPSQSVAT